MPGPHKYTCKAGDVRSVEPSLTYRAVMAFATPIVRWWGRLEVVGLPGLPENGPTLLMVNHDSAWDPLVVGVAAGKRQIRALAKASCGGRGCSTGCWTAWVRSPSTAAEATPPIKPASPLPV